MEFQQHGQGLRGVAVVVHHQDAAGGGSVAGRLRRQVWRRLEQDRQAHGELTALARTSAASFHRTAVHLHQVFHQG
jgi:hypothetical protein